MGPYRCPGHLILLSGLLATFLFAQPRTAYAMQTPADNSCFGRSDAYLFVIAKNKDADAKPIYEELERVKCNGEPDPRDNPEASIARSEVHYFHLEDKNLADSIVSFLKSRPGGLRVPPASYLPKYGNTRHVGEIEVLVKDGRK